MKMKLKRILAFVSAALLLVQALPVYADESYGKFVLYENNYRFPNGIWRTPELSEEHYKALCENLQNTEKFGAEKILKADGYGGSCYGMAVTSALSCYDLIDYKSYSVTPETAVSLYTLTEDFSINPEKIRPTIKTYSLINYYSLLQLRNHVRQYCVRQVYQHSQAEQMQNLLESLKDQSPTVITFHGWSERVVPSGKEQLLTAHAILAYGIEYGEYIWDNMHFDGKVLIYDNAGIYRDGVYENKEEFDRSCLYFDSKTLDWYLPDYQIGSETGGSLDMICDDITLLNDGGLCGGTEPYLTDEQYIDVLTTNKLESPHQIITEDGTIPSEMQECEAFFSDADVDAETNYILPGEEKGYCIAVEKPQKIHAALYYQNSIQLADAESSSKIVVSPNGKTEIDDNHGTYRLESVYNTGYFSGTYYDISVNGTSESASLQQTKDGYLLTANSMQDVTVTVRNDEETQQLVFSTNEHNVRLFETEQHTFAASIDTDHDGKYETLLAKSNNNVYTELLGDVDENGVINASDAARVLIAAAAIGVGKAPNLTERQKNSADVNSDGRINAFDASIILQYAAAVGVGKNCNLIDFVR